MRIGLCLAGGGAKGAYEAGVIKALYDKGIKNFSSISGTSIGAVNGYFIYTQNVEKLEDMWINIEQNSKKGVSIKNNIVDNSEVIENLNELYDNSNESTNFYVNYVKVKNKNIEEVVEELSKLDKVDRLNAIKYSSLLPFNPKGTLNLKDQFIKDVNEGMYEDYNLDGGLVRNTLIEPLIDDNVDKVIIISTRHDFELSDKIKSKFNENKIIVVRPKTELTSKDTLKFNNEFCKRMFNEGYEIGSSINIEN